MRYVVAAALALVSTAVPQARAATLPLITPGPPISTEGYLEVTLLSPSDGAFARVVNQSQGEILVDGTFWMPRVTSMSPSQYLGVVELIYPNNDAVGLKFQPEIDAGLASVDVSIGARVGNFRPVTHTGAGGYSRTYDANAIPEPAGLVLALVSCLVMRRRR